MQGQNQELMQAQQQLNSQMRTLQRELQSEMAEFQRQVQHSLLQQATELAEHKDLIAKIRSDFEREIARLDTAVAEARAAPPPPPPPPPTPGQRQQPHYADSVHGSTAPDPGASTSSCTELPLAWFGGWPQVVPASLVEATIRELIRRAAAPAAPTDIWAAGRVWAQGGYARYGTVAAVHSAMPKLRQQAKVMAEESPELRGFYATKSTPPEVRSRARALGSALTALASPAVQAVSTGCTWTLEVNGALIEEGSRYRVATVTTTPPAVAWLHNELRKLKDHVAASSGIALDIHSIVREITTATVEAIESTSAGDTPLGSLLWAKRAEASAVKATEATTAGGGPVAVAVKH